RDEPRGVIRVASGPYLMGYCHGEGGAVDADHGQIRMRQQEVGASRREPYLLVAARAGTNIPPAIPMGTGGSDLGDQAVAQSCRRLDGRRSTGDGARPGG